MIGIGILYLAVTHSMVKEVLNPFLLAVIPSNRIAYIIFFSLLAPLSLYRGPMNLFGLGSGIAALVIGLGTLSPLAVMGAFLLNASKAAATRQILRTSGRRTLRKWM